MSITTKQYTEKRDELVRILDSTAEVLDTVEKEYPDLKKYCKEMNIMINDIRESVIKLKDFSKRTRESIYRIQLLSRFQGGKSTTANALADGHILSPMGNSVSRCSAVVVKIQNVVNDADVGATIQLRSKKELQYICSNAFNEEINLDDEKQVKNALLKVHEFAKALQSNEWRQALDSVEKEQEGISLSREQIQNIVSEKRDLIQVAGLILQFYNDPYLKSLREQAGKDRILNMNIEDATSFAPVPNNYIVRYDKIDPSVFKIKEVMFPFVSEILFRTKSKEMEAIGAALTDTPGLFANDFDTLVTKMELINTNAIWFLAEAKQLSQAEKEALSKEVGTLANSTNLSGRTRAGEDIFFSVNIKNNRVAKDDPNFNETILSTLRSNIRDAGIHEPQLYPYHALLALLAAQGERVFENTLSAQDISWLRSQPGIRNAETMPLDNLWAICVIRCIKQLYLADEYNPHDIVTEFVNAMNHKDSETMIRIARRESGIDDVMNAIKQFVIKNRARSILIDEGAKKAENALHNDLEQPLINLETSAKADADTMLAKLNEQKKALDTFLKKAKELLQPFQDNGSNANYIDSAYVSDLYEYAFQGAVNTIVDKATPDIREITGIAHMIKKLANKAKGFFVDIYSQVVFGQYSSPKKTDSVKVEAQKCVEKHTNNVIIEKSLDWLTIIPDREPTRNFAKSLKVCQQQIELEWKENCSKYNKSENTIHALNFPCSIEANIKENMSTIMSASRKFDIVDFLTTGFAIGGSACFVLGLFFMGTPFAPIGLIIASIAVALSPSEDDLRKKIENNLRSELVKIFIEKKEDIKQLLLKNSKVREIRRGTVAESLEKPLNDLETRFNKDYMSAVATAKAAADVRQSVANLCHNIREEKIVPLLTDIRRFTDETNKLLE